MLLLPQFVQENVYLNPRTTLGFLLLSRFITKNSAFGSMMEMSGTAGIPTKVVSF